MLKEHPSSEESYNLSRWTSLRDGVESKDANVRMTWRPRNIDIGYIPMQFHNQGERFSMSKIQNFPYGD